MLDYHAPQQHHHQFPHRTLPELHVPQPSPRQPRLKPLTQIVPDGHQQQHQRQHQQQHQTQAPAPTPTHYQSQTQTAHTRSRTASSTALPGSLPLAISPQQPPIPEPAAASSTTVACHPSPPPPPPPPKSTTPTTSTTAATTITNMNPYKPFNRRTLSNGTDSTSTTGAGLIPVRTSSTSSRSTGSQTGYVALMRRQKATVWCDRSQYEDPRLIAQQKAARIRADREIVGSASRASTGGGGGGGSGSFTGGSLGARGKIRHHGKGSSAATGLTPTALVGGVGVVPLRLSASEVGDEGGHEDDGDSAYLRTMTAGGRSSLGSSSRHPNRISDGRIPPHVAYQYVGGVGGPGGPGPSGPGRFSGDATPSSNGSGGSDGMGDPTPMPHHHQHHHQQQQQQQHHHHHHHLHHTNPTSHRVSTDYFAQPGGSGNSGSSGERERERSFGGLGRMVEHPTDSSLTVREHRPSQQSQAQQDQQQQQQQQQQNSGVGRRDSVDERTSTMTGIRLFVANPDP